VSQGTVIVNSCSKGNLDFPALFPVISVLSCAQTRTVSHKRNKIAALSEPFQGLDLDARYLGYFACFNQKRFFEAHEVLEDLWLADRHGPDGAFYKGLIQLAGAFVHLEKQRPSPAAALLRLTLANLKKYSAVHHRLNLAELNLQIERLLQELGQGRLVSSSVAPPLNLEENS